jgi:hypothetical protein
MIDLILLFACIEQNDLLYKFLQHYKTQGCINACCAVTCDIDTFVIKDIFPNAVIKQTEVIFNGLKRQLICNKLRSQINANSWYVIADVDEFVLYKNKTLAELVEHANKCGYDNIRGRLIDRFTDDKTLPKKLKENIWEQFPNIINDFTKNVVQGCDKKVVAAKQPIPIIEGHHDCKSDNYDKYLCLPVYHFKWWGNIIKRLEERYKTNTPWKDESRRVIRWLNRNTIVK